MNFGFLQRLRERVAFGDTFKVGLESGLGLEGRAASKIRKGLLDVCP